MDELPQTSAKWMKWLVAGLIVIFFGGLSIPIVRYLWEHRPMDDATLFETRCTACHRLPSLDRERNWNWGTVVATMRYYNGADRVISDEEEGRIIEYLERQHEARWKNRPEEQ